MIIALEGLEQVIPFEVAFQKDYKIVGTYTNNDEKYNAFSKGDIALVREYKPDGLVPFFFFYSSDGDLLGSLKKVDFDNAVKNHVIRRK